MVPFHSKHEDVRVSDSCRAAHCCALELVVGTVVEGKVVIHKNDSHDFN